jgi:ABC-type microcin C transport system duplicated ATPase subunit YejF
MDIGVMRRHELLGVRKAMQMVFQNPFASFNPSLGIGSQLLEICRYYGMGRDESAA